MEGEQPSSSKNWPATRKSISLPDFCVNSGHCPEAGEDNASYIKIKTDILNNETHILIRSPSPSIVITPPPFERSFRYSPYLKGANYSKLKRHNISIPEISSSYIRWPKRRNAVSSNDLEYGRSLLLLPNEPSESLELKCKNPAALKLKKRVTFTNSSPVIRQHEDFKDTDVVTTLDRITADCIKMFDEMRTTNTPDTSALANNFRNACQISLPKKQSICTETLCARLSAMPLNESITTVNATPISTSASFIACNMSSCNMASMSSCLNL